MARCHITREPNAPASAPNASGDHFINTDNGDRYESNGTASVANWILNASGGPVTHLSTTGQTANDHHNEAHTVASHSDTTATGAALNELTDGSVTTLHSHSGGGGTDTILISFGAKLDMAGRFMQANGRSSDADETSKAKTRQPLTAGTITKLSYRTKAASTSSVMKLHVNGIVKETITLTNLSSFGGVETLSTVVADSDYCELEWDSGTAPGESIMNLIMEPS